MRVKSIKFEGTPLNNSALVTTLGGVTRFDFCLPQSGDLQLPKGVRGSLVIVEVAGRLAMAWEGVRFDHIDEKGQYIFFGDQNMKVSTVQIPGD